MATQTVFVRLRKGVSGLGSEGDVREVAFGYARNFLVPRGFASIVPASTAHSIQASQQVATERHASERRAVIDIAQSLDGRSVTMKLPANDDGRLFAGVQADDVAEALGADPIFRMNPLKQGGTHQVVLDFGHDIMATVTVIIQPQAARRR